MKDSQTGESLKIYIVEVWVARRVGISIIFHHGNSGMPKSEKEPGLKLSMHPQWVQTFYQVAFAFFLEFILANMKLQSGLNSVGSIDDLERINAINSKDFRSFQCLENGD